MITGERLLLKWNSLWSNKIHHHHHQGCLPVVVVGGLKVELGGAPDVGGLKVGGVVDDDWLHDVVVVVTGGLLVYLVVVDVDLVVVVDAGGLFVDEGL